MGVLISHLRNHLSKLKFYLVRKNGFFSMLNHIISLVICSLGLFPVYLISTLTCKIDLLAGLSSMITVFEIWERNFSFVYNPQILGQKYLISQYNFGITGWGGHTLWGWYRRAPAVGPASKKLTPLAVSYQ